MSRECITVCFRWSAARSLLDSLVALELAARGGGRVAGASAEGRRGLFAWGAGRRSAMNVPGEKRPPMASPATAHSWGLALSRAVPRGVGASV